MSKYKYIECREDEQEKQQIHHLLYLREEDAQGF